MMKNLGMHRVLSLSSLLLGAFLLMFSAPVQGAGETVDSVALKVYYLEFPPYYYTNEQGQPDGFLLKKADAIFRHAHVAVEYECLSGQKILQEMRSDVPSCSIGWFKIPRRELFARFSKPIYHNKSLLALILKENEAAFEGKTSFAQFMADKKLVLGVVDSYSLGAAVDQLIKEGNPTTTSVVGGYPQLVRLLAFNTFSYLLAAPEEIDMLIAMNHLSPDIFVRKNLDDMPAGNARYLMFSRGVPDALIARLDRAIEQLR